MSFQCLYGMSTCTSLRSIQRQAQHLSFTVKSMSTPTTHLSQMTDILSSVPLTPSGIRLKSSLPTARWAVLKGQCALPVTCRSPLWSEKSSSLLLFNISMILCFSGTRSRSYLNSDNLTRTAGSWDSLVWLGRGSAEERWRRRLPSPSSCSSSGSHPCPSMRLSALHKQQYLSFKKSKMQIALHYTIGPMTAGSLRFRLHCILHNTLFFNL